MATEPNPNCPRCPRLHGFLRRYRELEPDWHNAPVPTLTPVSGNVAVKLLIVGLAPGLRGANRTGRAFTGDASGQLLFANLTKFGFVSGKFENMPDDGMRLVDCAITNAVRCVPPENKPKGKEVENCRAFLAPTIDSFPNLGVLLALGKTAHDSSIRALNLKVSELPFAHGAQHHIDKFTMISSYHCSRYNVNTGRLTTDMFEDIFRRLRILL